MAKEKPANKVIQCIKKNYKYLNQMMVEEIDLASEHGGISGNYREEMWIKFFRSIIPKKYSLAQGVIIIDSKEGSSREVDIAVFDEQYTPYVFQYNTLKFIPIEAVAVVIECKSQSWEEAKLKEWVARIKALEPSTSGVTRMANGYVTGITNQAQQRTRPIRILASNFQKVNEETIERNIKKVRQWFDFILVKKAEPKTGEEMREFKLFVPYEEKKLGWWGAELNQYNTTKNLDEDLNENLRIGFGTMQQSSIQQAKQSNKNPELEISSDGQYLKNTLKDLKVSKNPLLTLNLQLNQLLMLLNNPMLFPHFAYAKRFNEIQGNGESPASGGGET